VVPVLAHEVWNWVSPLHVWVPETSKTTPEPLRLIEKFPPPTGGFDTL
jgi:hypothetical protein